MNRSKKFLVYFLLPVVFIVLTAGPTVGCACEGIEKMSEEGYTYSEKGNTTLLFRCDGKIAFSKKEIRLPNLWEQYWYRAQIATAERGCALGER